MLIVPVRTFHCYVLPCQQILIVFYPFFSGSFDQKDLDILKVGKRRKWQVANATCLFIFLARFFMLLLNKKVNNLCLVMISIDFFTSGFPSLFSCWFVWFMSFVFGSFRRDLRFITHSKRHAFLFYSSPLHFLFVFESFPPPSISRRFRDYFEELTRGDPLPPVRVINQMINDFALIS